MSHLNQFKQKYRTRYYGNRGQDIPDLKPGDNPMSFVNNYLNISASISDGEDDEESINTRRLPSAHMESSVPQNRQKEAQGSSSEFDVKDKPLHSQGDGHSVTKGDPPAIPNALRESELSNDKMFTDDESDDEETHVVAKLIEESLSESESLDNKPQNNSHKPREKLYSSDTSVVQEPPSPTSNIQAKKWLSFKDSTFTTNNNAFGNIVLKTSEGFTINTQQLKLQEAINSNHENPNRADITYDLQNGSPDNVPRKTFVIEEEGSCNLDSWVSPFKKKKAPPLSIRPREDQPTTTPKEKTNSSEASRSLKRKSENVKVSLINSVTVERPTDEFVIEEEGSCDLGVWVSPFKKKKTSLEIDVASKEKANSVEASRTLQKKSANVKISLISSTSAERPTDEFVIEEEGSCDLDVWVSPFKKKQTSPTSARLKDNQPTPKKTNSIEPPSSLQKNSENVKASLIISAPAERMANTEKANDLNARNMSFANIFFNTTRAGHIGSRLSSVVSEAPAISTTVIIEEEFEIEDVSDINESKLLTIPVKAKPLETGHLGKGEKSGQQLQKTGKVDKHPELEVIKAALPQAVEGVKPKGSSFQDRVVVGIEKQLASSQDADFPQVVEGIERNESIHHDDLPAGNDSHYTDEVHFTPLKQVQQPQQIGLSTSTEEDWNAAKIFGNLDETFSITLRKGKGSAKSEVAAKKTKTSKQPEVKQKEHLVKEKKSKTKSKKKRKSPRGRRQTESAKDCMTNDLRTGEILEASTVKRAPRKRTHNNEVDKADMKKNAEATVCRQPPRESLEIGNNDKPQTVTDEGLQSKKRKAKLKNICTPCPADHNKEDSVFQSGPITRQRAVPFPGPAKPLACDLDFADTESGGEEEQVLSEDESDEVVVGLDKEKVAVEHFTGGPKTNKQICEEQEEFLRRYSIVFDPDTRSDALVECIAQSDRSEFVGSDCCTYWNSFDNHIFTTGKLIIAPKKKSQRRIFVSKIVIYYVEQGLVQVNIHKSERLLKDGDFFFVPPGNFCTVTNLQDKKAVLVYNFLNLVPLFTED